jgi:two-component system, NtrC family, response regulator HydG
MKKSEGTIWIVDDDEAILISARLLLNQFFDQVVGFSSPEHIRDKVRTRTPDVVVLDMNYQPGATGGEEGFFWLKYMKEHFPNTSVVMITAFAEVELAVKAMHVGAMDFVVKPWNNEKFVATIKAAIALSQSSREVERLKKHQSALNTHWVHEQALILGQSPAMARIKELIDRIGSTDADVLLLGENGTGKGVLARELHARSLRKDKPFIQVDLGAIPETLFESELFGYTKGSFTGANSDKSGKFEIANGGTIFLDEIGNLPMHLQSKILSVLQNRSVSEIGSQKEIPLDVRVISATNQPLQEMVEKGTFRKDLYYRINLIEIEIPPLRKRPEDIPALAGFFLERFNIRYNKKIKRLDGHLLRHLQQHNWPGNIRELQHAIERAVILAVQDHLEPEDIMLKPLASVAPDLSGYQKLEEVEKIVFMNAYHNLNKNVTQAARVLGISRSSFYRYKEKYGL